MGGALFRRCVQLAVAMLLLGTYFTLRGAWDLAFVSYGVGVAGSLLAGAILWLRDRGESAPESRIGRNTFGR
jgi:hypothetical protein